MKPPIETESGHTERQQMYGTKPGELELCAGSSVQTRKGLLYAAVGLGLLLTIYPLLAMLNYAGTSESHGTIEWVGAVIAIIAGLAMVSRFHVQGNRLHLFIGLAFLVNGAEDVAHSILSMAGPRWISADSLSHFIPETYVTGRLLCGVLLVLAPFARRLFGTSDSPKREMAWVSGITVWTMLVMTTLAFLLPLPRFIRPEWFISRPVDLLAGMVFLAAFVVSVREYRRNGYAFYWWLLLAIGASVYGQLAMSVSKSLYDIPFEAAHVYKLIGYLLPLLGFCLIEINLVEHRKRLQEATDALRENEEYLSITLHSIGDAVIATDTAGRVVRMNPVAERLTGWPLAEAVGKPLAEIFRIINARTREPASDPLAEALATGEVVVLTNDTALIARDGAERQIADSAAPIRDAQGRIRGAVLVFHDVTSEYEVKKALRERVKELTCIQRVRGGLQAGLSVEQLCQNTVEHMVQGVGYPEIAVAVITLGDQQFSSGRSAEGLTYGLHASIEVAGGAHGRLSVFYTENKSFLLPYEQNLVNAVATILSHWLESKRAAEELACERKNLKAIFEASPVGLLLMDENAVVTAVNDVASRLAGKTAAEMINRQPGETLNCVHASDDARGCGHGPCCPSCPIRATIEGVFRSGQPVRAVEVQPVLSIGGSTISPWLEIGAEPVTIDGKRHVIASVTNITERKRMEGELRRLAVIAQQAAEGIAVADLDGNIRFANDAWARMHGYGSGAELVGKHLGVFHTDEQLKTDVIPFNEVVTRRGYSAGEVGHVRKDGTTFPAQMIVTLLKDEQGEPYGLAGFAQDITDRKRAEEALRQANTRLEELATTDDLTGLANRRRFMDMLHREMERAKRHGSPLALAMLDVDGFKAINDTHGHAFGDRVLTELAKTLRGGARACDTVARYGGDEFMILMPETRFEEALGAVERMRKAFADRTISDGRRSLRVTVSAGVSGREADGADTADALVRLADEALYAAKHSGRDRALAWSQICHDQAE